MATTGRTAPIVRWFLDNLVIGAATGIMNGVTRAVQEDLTSRVAGLGQALQKNKIPNDVLEATNLRIATAAQDAIVSGWRSRLPRKSAAYRPEDRLTGRLGAALQDGQMISGTSPRLISFINRDFLNSEARHWYRVNYGVEGTNMGHSEVRTYTVEFNGQPIMTLRDPNRPTPGGVYLPRRWMWVGNEFVVLRRWPVPYKGAIPNPEVGARAANFIDLGMETAARMIGPEYMEMFNNYYGSQKGRARLERAGIRVVSDIRLEPGGFTVRVT